VMVIPRGRSSVPANSGLASRAGRGVAKATLPKKAPSRCPF
jgi:hypothetical protein